MQRYVGRNPEGEEKSPQSAASSHQKKGESDSTVLMLKDIYYLSLANWKWFVLSIIIAIGVAIWYIKVTPPVYERSISILIKTKENAVDPLLKDLGIENVSSNITNEMELLKTGMIANEIVQRLNLNVEYLKKGPFHDNLLYGEESPVRISFIDLPENENTSFFIDIKDDNSVILKGINAPGAQAKQFRVKLNDTVNSPLGKIVITPTSTYKEQIGENLQVVHKDANNVAKNVRKNIMTRLRQKSSTIIDIKYQDVSKTRSEDVLNTLVGVYNENWIKDRNVKTLNIDNFIKDRLSFLEQELGDVEQNISAWKSQNLMLDVDQAGNFAQSQINEAERDMQNLNNQTYMTKYIKDYLTDGKHDNQLLPANSGITNTSIEHLIGEYNTILLNRNNHLTNSSSQNPLVKDLDENLDALKGSILQSLDYELTMLQSKANAIRARQGLAISRVASNPQKAQQLISVERQQKVKEELYLYLLEKREENELSQAFGAYNNQFIETPNGSPDPVYPVHNTVILIAFGIGILIPAAIIGLNEIFNTKVRGRKDISSLSAPYAGDIPLNFVKGKKKLKLKKGDKKPEVPEVYVVEGQRDVINEAFRVVRTNLEFILGFDAKHRVIMITSLNSGSGKTFITANLSTALAIRDKKVLAIDLDLRKGSLSKYVGKPKLGVSNYLSGQVHDFHDYIVTLGKVDVLPAGSLPPNPAELLFSPKFKEMIEKVKEEYDYVFLDCPPVEVVADASIISTSADLTLFVIRIGNLERDNLSDIEEWYLDKKYGNIAIMLNGVDSSSSRYGYHKYGYRKYGYHYGSYGYSNNE